MINSNICFAKHVFNPKIEKKSTILSKKKNDYCNKHECGTMRSIADQLIYIYQFPKNIDKMIKENPEFRDEIEKNQFDILMNYNEDDKTYWTVGGLFYKNYKNYIECFPDKEICDGHSEIFEHFKETIKCLPWKHECDSEDVNLNEAIEDIKQYDKNNTKLLELINIIQSGKKLKFNAISVRSCKDLWKYDLIEGYTTYAMVVLPIYEQHCNEIVKKVLKKTGRLY